MSIRLARSYVAVVLSLFLLYPAVLSAKDNNIDLGTVSVTVVLLETIHVETTKVDGKTYEILLRDSQTGVVKEKTSKSIGTGVLIADNKNNTFLVSADHVAKKTTKGTQVVVKGEGNRPKKIALVNLLLDPKDIDWKSHSTSDVAAIRLTIPTSLRQVFKEHFLPIGTLERELNSPDRNIPLVTLGFPFGFGVQGYFSPISREANTASGLLSLLRSDTKTRQDFFLLDSPSIGGFSGAPVLRLPGTYTRGSSLVFSSGVRCVGIVHGTISDNTGGKMAAITPAAIVVQLLEEMGAKISDG